MLSPRNRWLYNPLIPGRFRHDVVLWAWKQPAATGCGQCPLWVNNGHRGELRGCPLYPQKQTLELSGVMSALCQKQTFCAAVEDFVIRSPRRRGRVPAVEL